jgi:hypothetical protein
MDYNKILSGKISLVIDSTKQVAQTLCALPIIIPQQPKYIRNLLHQAGEYTTSLLGAKWD